MPSPATPHHNDYHVYLTLTCQLAQLHADAAVFSKDLGKAAAYAQLLETLTSLVADSRFWPTNLANTASLLWHLYHSLPGPSNAVNWAGFYVTDATSLASVTENSNANGSKLLLGPFMGKVACQVIQVGKGVCGAAAESGKTQLVADVEAFPGHIACDGESKSEIVVPVLLGGKVCLCLA